MFRTRLLTIASSVALAIASAQSTAQGQPAKKAAAPAAAPGATTGAATPPKANLTATVGESGYVYLTFTDVNSGATTYEISRSPKPPAAGTTPVAGAPVPPPLVVFQLPKGKFTAVDRSALNYLGTTFVYTLFPVNVNGLRSSGSISTASADIPKTIPATRQDSHSIQFADGSQWQKARGNWLPETGDAYSQTDDSQVGPALIFEEKSFWIGSKPVSVGAMQISAAVTLAGWDTVANLGNVFTTPPSFHFGIGFSNTEPSRTGIFLAVSGDLTKSGGVIEEDNGKVRQEIDISGLNWKPGATIRFKLRISRADKDPSSTAATPPPAPKATVIAKIWLDGQPEPPDSDYTPPVDWVWPTTGTVFPALFGGVQAVGNQAVKVTFTEVALDTFASPPVPIVSIQVPLQNVVQVPPLIAPDLDYPIQIPTVAITAAGTGRWGTLIGRVEPEGPVPVQCPPRLCPWIVPTSSMTACCGSSGMLAGTVVPWTSGVESMHANSTHGGNVVRDGTTMGGEQTGVPRLIPASPVTPHPSRVIPATESSSPPQQIQELTPAVSRRSGHDAKVRRVSYLPEEDAATVRHGTIAEGASRTNTTKPDPTLPPLDQTVTTLRRLRDFGAVATVPDPTKDPQDSMSDGEKKMVDAIVGEMLRSFPNVDQLGMSKKYGTNDFYEPLFKDKKPTDIEQIVSHLFGKLQESNISDDIKERILQRMGQFGSPEFEVALKNIKARIGKNELVPGTYAFVSRFRMGSPPRSFQGVSSEGVSQDAKRPGRDPFWCQPKISVIPLCPSKHDDDASGLLPGNIEPLRPPQDELLDKPDSHVWTYHFDHPARFPMIKYGSRCCAFEGEGAIIHEGMRLLARQDGQYEVRFNITTPSIPVLLRLQLILFEKGRPDPMDGRPIPRTLTLPPIVIRRQTNDPEAFPNDLEGGIYPTSYLVSVQGYSQVIKEAQEEKKWPGYLLLVKRNGTARIGSGVQYQATP